MRCKIFIAVTALISSFAGCKPDVGTKPVAIIFDSDIGPDYDDVGAITILHAMAQKGEARILATVASNQYEGIAAILNVFNTYWSQSDIPIGVSGAHAVDMRDSQHWTDTLLAKYPHAIKSNNEVAGAVEIYRKILAAQPDTSVTVLTVGFLTNLADLLKSSGDQYSALNGLDLVKKKVKLLVSMAGVFPSGREFNVYNDSTASQYTFDHWPTKIIFSGFEIGKQIKTGLPLIHNASIQQDPAKDVFSICIPLSPEDSAGRMSWDEVTTLVAVRGYQPYFTLQEGRIKVNADGSNSWDDKAHGQYYLVQKDSPEKIADLINDLMMEQPGNK